MAASSIAFCAAKKPRSDVLYLDGAYLLSTIPVMALNLSMINSFSLGISVPSAFKKQFSRNCLFSLIISGM